ncbi:AAA family ATPase [Rudanella paleaurantiibacter]|uniref:AAA family ATPase n=1 Tax=Rudanella paleaurantiibacter TaxID=2614655 RepID=A0A7J5TTA4_9BACT|nr:ParA family protein [Rudanella paleaurantiibacter]KAB7726892.1 AAA family ATPase [Rudanella paleaurantiibacter]
MTKILCFSSQKGGVGKTTLTALVATHLWASGKKVMVLDCDDPQHSLHRQGHNDLDKLRKEPLLAQEFNSQGLKPYEIAASNVMQAVGLLRLLKESGTADYIFVDLPGTLNVAGVEGLSELLDLLIVPFEMEAKVFASGVETLTFHKRMNPSLPLAVVYNRVKKGESPVFMESISDYLDKMNYAYRFKTILYDRVFMKRDSSTLFPSTEGMVESFMEEFAKLEEHLNETIKG